VADWKRLAKLGAAFVVGAVPVAQLVARRTTGKDLRRLGTGTVSATNVYQAGGVRPFAAASLLDVGKGALVAALVGRRDARLLATAAGLAVIGHNWSPFLRGAGGRGVLPAMGVLAVAAPSGAAVLGAGIVGGYVTGDSAPGCFAAQLLLVPVLARTHGRSGALLGMALTAPMLAKRAVGNRLPRPISVRTIGARLIYDRDTR
jgi:glycerol-3-phosphate acyltransferase PlsY